MKKAISFNIGAVALITLAMILSGCGKKNETLSLSLYEQNLEYQAGKFSFEVTSNTNWTVRANQNWLSIANGSGQNSGKVVVNYRKNKIPIDRNANITVTTEGGLVQTIAVKQKQQQNPLLGTWKYEALNGLSKIILFNADMEGIWQSIMGDIILENRKFIYEFDQSYIKLRFPNSDDEESLIYKVIGNNLQITEENGDVYNYVKQ